FSALFFSASSTTVIYTLSLHDALPIFRLGRRVPVAPDRQLTQRRIRRASHTPRIGARCELTGSLYRHPDGHSPTHVAVLRARAFVALLLFSVWSWCLVQDG